MGNTQQQGKETIKFGEGEKHPVALDPSTVYEVNVSGWFQWTDTTKIPAQRKTRSDDWRFSFTVSNCFVSGREDTNSPIVMKDGTEYKLSRALEGYFGEGEVKMLATYSDGTKTSFKGTYYGINNDVFIELECQMLEGGELGKVIFFNEGKGGGQCVITPIKSNLSSTVEGAIRFFFNNCDFNVMEFFMSKLTVRELRALRLVTSWFKEAITYKFAPMITYKELRDIESLCIGCYGNLQQNSYLRLFDTHYELHTINRTLIYPIVGLWRLRRLTDPTEYGYRLIKRDELLSPNTSVFYVALGGFGSNAWMDSQVTCTLNILPPPPSHTYRSDGSYARVVESEFDTLVKEAREKVAQEIHDEKVEEMKGDLRKVGSGVLSVAKVVGMAVTFPISVPIYYYLENRDKALRNPPYDMEYVNYHYDPGPYYYHHHDEWSYNQSATPSTPLRMPYERDGF